MIDLFQLSGRVVLLTGATGGIGEPAARLLAEAGARLVLSCKDATRLADLVSALRDEGHACDGLVCDLSGASAVRGLAERALGLAGRIDVLICNGGMEGFVGPIGQASEGDIDTLFAVNLRSAMTLTAAVIPGMADRGGGSVILVASIAGLRGNRSIGLYGVAKAGLSQLARNLAVEWGPSGVRVNSLSPGLIRTPFARPILENADYLPRRLSLTPLRRAGEPAEVAGAILFLASDAGGFTTGHNLVVDGGTTISDGN
ncbi:SDR family NAD(P)-dependent oxidoreductase [Brevundimonas sp.]|uniref:SDR family NAD(P)-dependent oxidoreductase n=1 Tax=Brevundimonas sp. TaxID=1871086 RepID=UPI003D0EB2A6